MMEPVLKAVQAGGHMASMILLGVVAYGGDRLITEILSIRERLATVEANIAFLN